MVMRKFEDALSHMGWVKNGQSHNYCFGSMRGIELAVAKHRSQMTVLDFGCGRGDFLVQLASVLDEGSILLGVTGGWKSEIHPDVLVSADAFVDAVPYLPPSEKYTKLIQSVRNEIVTSAASLHPKSKEAAVVELCFPLDVSSLLQRIGTHALRNTVNLVLSSWTFLHLSDPLGTMVELYNNVLADDGLLVINHFYADIADGGELCVRQLLAILSAQGYFVGIEEEKISDEDEDNSNEIDPDQPTTTLHVCIRRTAENPKLVLPVKYAGVVNRCWHTVQPQYCIFHYDWDGPLSNDGTPTLLEGKSAESKDIPSLQTVCLGESWVNSVSR